MTENVKKSRYVKQLAEDGNHKDVFVLYDGTAHFQFYPGNGGEMISFNQAGF